MSKFCGILTDSPKCRSPLKTTLSYQQLESLNYWLGKEIEETQLDFLRKVQFVNKQDVKLFENMEQLLHLSEEIKNLKAEASFVDEEIEFQIELLQRIQDFVNEKENKEMQNISDTKFQTGCLSALTAIETMDDLFIEMNWKLCEINDKLNAQDANQFAQEDDKDITGMLSSQLKLLEKIEKDLKHLENAVENVSTGLTGV